MNPRQKIESLLNLLPHKLQVEFALYCAEDSFIYVEEKDKAIVKSCNDTVKRWLNGKATHKEVSDVSYASATAAATASSYASATAAAASYAAASSYASAAYAAYASSAAAAATTAAATTAAAYDKKMEEYLSVLKRIVSSLSEIERLVFRVENI